MFSRSHKTYCNIWISRTGHSRKVKVMETQFGWNPNLNADHQTVIPTDWKDHEKVTEIHSHFTFHLIFNVPYRSNKLIFLSFSPQCLLRLWGSCLALVCSSFLWLYSFFTSITNYPLRVPTHCPALTSTERAQSQQVCRCFSAIVRV